MPVFGTVLSNATVVFSQWTTAGSDIYYIGGNVGIGVTLPSAPLEIASVGATNPHIVLSGNATGGAHISRKVTTGRLQVFGGTGETDGGSIWAFGNTYTPTPAIQGSVVVKLGKVGGGAFYIDDASYNDMFIFNEDSSFEFYNTSGGVQKIGVSVDGKMKLGTGSATARIDISGLGATSATFGQKIFDSASNLNFSVRDDGQVAAGGGSDAFYQMKINTSPTFIGGLFIDNGSRTGYCLELSGTVGHGAYINVPTNQNAIEVIAGRSQFGGIVGIGSPAQSASSLRVTSDGTFSTNSCIKIENTASSGIHYGIDIELSTVGTQTQYGAYFDVRNGTTNYSIYSLNGMVNLQSIQIGNGGLVSGDLYKDTAANILANGDYVVGMKV